MIGLWISIIELWMSMDISHGWTMDIHDWVCIYTRRSFIRFWISIDGMLPCFQPIYSIELHHDITAFLRHNRFQKIYAITGPRGWERDVFFSSNCHNISLWFTNHDYKTGQPCYNTVWAYFTSRYDMQLKLKRDLGLHPQKNSVIRHPCLNFKGFWNRWDNFTWMIWTRNCEEAKLQGEVK